MEHPEPELAPSLTGRLAIITGANTGLGFEAAKALYARGAHVVVAGRNESKVRRAVEDIHEAGGTGVAEAGILDLASLNSVREFAERILDRHDHLDILLNNAGVMATPPGRTQDGFEMQFGVNFVGHFALTGRLFPLLSQTPGARVVTMSSIAHRGASIDFDNLRLEKPYDPWKAYGQSKLADLILALELDRRLRDAASPVASLAAHPGVSQSELVRHLPGATPPGVEFMPTANGVQPALVAACSDQAKGGEYWGPNGPNETAGEPAIAVVDAAARIAPTNKRLWEWAQDATGISFP